MFAVDLVVRIPIALEILGEIDCRGIVSNKDRIFATVILIVVTTGVERHSVHSQKNHVCVIALTNVGTATVKHFARIRIDLKIKQSLIAVFG